MDVTDGVSDTELAELCYQYKYDYRNRLVEKKIPGKGLESIVYNKLDQPVMTQDANQYGNSEWLFTKYDAFGRVAYTGKLTDTKERSVLQTDANEYTGDLWVTRGSAVMIGGVTMKYDDGGYPKAQNGEVLTINYYDDYNFDTAGINNPGTVYGVGTSDRTRSLATGSKVKVLGTSYWTTTVTYYDKKARPIYTASINEYLNTTDIVETKLDFVGKVEETTTRHTKGTNPEIKTVDVFTYDHMGRLTQQTQKINNQDTEQIAANQYDELGQLTSKKVGGIASSPVGGGAVGVGGLQTVDYTYNIRGWLKGINDVNNLGNDLFAFGIGYNQGTNPLYNGNISKTSWKTANDNIVRSYDYRYDALNRILRANSNDDKYNLSGVTYDKMGNILTLNRKGHNNLHATNFGYMDVLDYTYDSGNKLMKVSDTGPVYGFRDGTNTNDDFDYDANGNMILDQNKGISSITYNHLNLPETVSISNNEGTGTISYIYDATGAKLKKIVTEGSSLTTEYAGKYVYKNDQLQYMATPEGYATPEGNSYRYVYQFKDHLENVRLSYTKNDSGNLEIIEESNYYPFGLKHKGYNSTVSSLGNSTAQLLGFGGKEEQDELGLGWIDITARNYDPALGRWMNIDPLAESMRRHSPYNYAFDNPVYYIDPDGMVAMAFDWINNGDGTYTAQKGDSAKTLSEDAGISLEDADKIVQSQLGKNYEGEDGEMKSDVEVGDTVAVPEQVEAIAQKNEVVEWNENVTSGIKDDISSNETAIDKNNKDVDSLNNVKETIDNDAKLREESGVYEPAPGDPKIGLAIGRATQQIRDARKKKAIDKQINKLNNKSDSLNKVNEKKKKEVKRRDSLYGKGN